MPPSHQELETALIDGTCQVYSTDPDAISVNRVRRHVEQKFDLEEDFFAGDEWKHRSKAIIKEYVDKLLDGWEPEPKSGVKRSSSEAASPQPKRRKRASQSKPLKRDASPAGAAEETPKASNVKASKAKSNKAGARKAEASKAEASKTAASKAEASKAEASKTAASKAEASKTSASKTAASKTAARRKPKATVSVDEADLHESPPPKKAVKRDVEEESEGKDKDNSEHEEMTEAPAKTHAESSEEKKSEEDGDGTEPLKDEEAKPVIAVIDEEEEYSDVIDEPPPTKRKAKDNKDATKPSRSASKKASVSTADDTNEGEIKKLQSQLVKCGIRKLWHNELKKYGSDSRAKIRHLKKMLADVGMDGRFSEAKAREIKETRELVAEAEAAQQMNRLWGMSSGGRTSRSKSKSTKVEGSEGSGGGGDNGAHGQDGGDGDGDDDEGDNTFAARRRRARADLAFLGDDSDSD